jgi:hypothetical protein
LASSRNLTYKNIFKKKINLREFDQDRKAKRKMKIGGIKIVMGRNIGNHVLSRTLEPYKQAYFNPVRGKLSRRARPSIDNSLDIPIGKWLIKLIVRADWREGYKPSVFDQCDSVYTLKSVLGLALFSNRRAWLSNPSVMQL